MTGLARFIYGNENAEQITTRTLDGQHWYAAAVICALLGISNPTQAVRTLDVDEWRKESVYNGGYGKKKLLMISNKGMLKLLVKTRSDQAEYFKAVAMRTPTRFRTDPWPEELNAEVTI